MATIAAVLYGTGHRPALDLVQKFLENFACISDALEAVGLWDDEDGFFYDRILLSNGCAVPIRVRSIVAMIPLLAAAVVNEEVIDRTLVNDKMFAEYLRRHGLGGTAEMADAGILRGQPGQRRLLVGVTGLDRVRRLCRVLCDPEEFLSPHGLRSLSAYHRDHPYVVEVAGVRGGIDYEPAESTTAMFGGNSNWRGPVWFPLNYLAATALERYHEFFGDELTIEHPTGSGVQVTLDVVAADLWERLVSLFLIGRDGRRPCWMRGPAHSRSAAHTTRPRDEQNCLHPPPATADEPAASRLSRARDVAGAWHAATIRSHAPARPVCRPAPGVAPS